MDQDKGFPSRSRSPATMCVPSQAGCSAPAPASPGLAQAPLPDSPAPAAYNRISCPDQTAALHKRSALKKRRHPPPTTQMDS